uniref:Putative MFS transporter n=2 Tax=Moniliophthora roreri TaxID=221103 RepID=A0A0W0FIY0_MONRR
MSAATAYEREMTKKVLWKLDCHILPPLALLWLANFIDRSNIGNARIAGLERDANLHGNQFNVVLTVFYASYLLIELPSNWILKRMGPNRWLPIIVCVWGIVTTLTGLVHNFGGLLAIRIFLGFCEGGLLPGMVLYLSTLYKRHELQLRVGIFYASASLSGAFGGLLATAISKMEGVGGLAGWRWIFILEGMATILLAGVAAIFLPETLATAKFFTEEERTFAVQRFRSDHVAASVTDVLKERSSPSLSEKQDESRLEETPQPFTPAPVDQEEEQFEWREIKRGALSPSRENHEALVDNLHFSGFLDIQTWLTGIAYFGLVVSLYSYSLFLPTIVSGLGYSGPEAQLRTVPPYVPATVITVVVAFLSDRLRWRGPFILICLPIAIAGYILAIVATTNTARYAAVFLMATGVYPSGPCILSILPNNSSGHFKKATTTALQLAIANCGGFVATFAYTQGMIAQLDIRSTTSPLTPDQAPKYIKGHSIALAFLCLAWVLIAANV